MWAMQVADPADVGNGVFRQAAVSPGRDAAVFLWAALLRRSSGADGLRPADGTIQLNR
jgi:hypothetical protein